MADILNINLQFDYTNVVFTAPAASDMTKYGLGPENRYPLDFSAIGERATKEAMGGWFVAWGRKIDGLDTTKMGAMGILGDAMWPTLRGLETIGAGNGTDVLLHKLEISQEVMTDFSNQLCMVALRVGTAELVFLVQNNVQTTWGFPSYTYDSVKIPFPFNAVYPSKKNRESRNLVPPPAFNRPKMTVEISWSTHNNKPRQHGIVAYFIIDDGRTQLIDTSGIFDAVKESPVILNKRVYQWILESLTIRGLPLKPEQKEMFEAIPDEERKPAAVVLRELTSKMTDDEVEALFNFVLSGRSNVVNKLGKVYIRGQGDDVTPPIGMTLPKPPKDYRWAINAGGIYLFVKKDQMCLPYDAYNLPDLRDQIEQTHSPIKKAELQKEYDLIMAFFQQQKDIANAVGFTYEMALML